MDDHYDDQNAVDGDCADQNDMDADFTSQHLTL